MRNYMKKITAFFTSIIIILSMLLTGCTVTDPHADAVLKEYETDNKPVITEKVEIGVFDSGDMIYQDGTLLKTVDGETVYLRGVNLGGYFLTEYWMCQIFEKATREDGTGLTDCYKRLNEALLERFGKEKTVAFWEEYRQNFFNETDFELLRDMGVNCIRLPITYMQVDFDALYGYNLAAYEYDFSAVDAFIEKAASYGIYTILDLHGAYGSQNGADHSGEIKVPTDYYSNEEMMQLTVDLWRAMADHYKDNPAIAAYDILNEPGEHKEGGGTQSTTTRHWDLMDRLYDAIREVDTNHVVIFESCWEASNLPHPSKYGWKNCMYSFHHYTGGGSGHNKSFQNKIDSVNAANFGVPLHMGEFTCYDDSGAWEYSLNALNESGWHWHNWTYKVNRGSSTNSQWGYISVTAKSHQINVYTDSYEDMLEAVKQVRTDNLAHKTDFSDGQILVDIVAKYLK